MAEDIKDATPSERGSSAESTEVKDPAVTNLLAGFSVALRGQHTRLTAIKTVVRPDAESTEVEDPAVTGLLAGFSMALRGERPRITAIKTVVRPERGENKE